VPQAKIVDGKTYSIISDHLGTPILSFDEKGNKVWECELDIYGKARTFKGNKTFIPFLYQGQYYDEETNLAYNRFRYYSPDSGTYISQDPIGLSGGDNLYGYTVDSNRLVDPFGLAGGNFVYGLFDAGATDPYYIGITNDPDRRALEHMDSGRLSDSGDLRVLKDDLDEFQARGQEQHLMEKHKTKTGVRGEKISATNRGNKVNSFDKARTDARGKKFKAEYDKAKKPKSKKPKISCG